MLEIGSHFGTDRYLGGGAAQDYLDVARFTAQGIQVEWQNYRHPTYPQMHGAFLSHLSALDLLLNAGPASSHILRGET
ncbi:MAG: WbqC family protein [Betaproteobacteria bacterium]|nr:WbqC family protein [Betaproteobacteria bacterium]